MLTVWLIILVLFLTLTVLLWGGAVFFQGYIYTEPSQGIPWRAPAAAAALAAFFALWCILVINADGTPTNIPYDTLFRFSAREDLVYAVKEGDGKLKYTSEPLREIYAVKERDGDVKYIRGKDNFGKVIYKDTTAAHRPWNRSGVRAIYVETADRKKFYFEALDSEPGKYREFATQDGWVMAEYENGPNGVATIFRMGRFLTNLFLNFFHFSLWFCCLWLLLRFQWGHALGLAAVLWLIMSLAILPMVLEQAARGNVPTAARTTSRAIPGLIPKTTHFAKNILFRNLFTCSDIRQA